MEREREGKENLSLFFFLFSFFSFAFFFYFSLFFFSILSNETGDLGIPIYSLDHGVLSVRLWPVIAGTSMVQSKYSTPMVDGDHQHPKNQKMEGWNQGKIGDFSFFNFSMKLIADGIS